MRVKKAVTTVAVFVLCTVFSACGADQSILISSGEEAEAGESTQTEERDSSGGIFVYVCGAVACPGVYELPENARIIDAVTAASGFSESAACDYLNQAELVSDGEKIYVPTIAELAALSGDTEACDSAVSGISADGRVNINYASSEQLQTISGIGETRAAAIIAYREEKGLFASIDEIVNVSGIGDSTFEKIKEFITVN